MKNPECVAIEEALANLAFEPDAALPTALERHLVECAECRAEAEWLRGTSADYAQIGEDYVARRMADMGEVDVLRDVMAGVKRLQAAPARPTVTVTFQPTRRRMMVWRAAAGLAAASVLLGLVWVLAYNLGKGNRPGEALPTLAKTPIELTSGLSGSDGTSATLKNSEVASRINRELQDNRRKLSAAGPLVQEAMRAAKDSSHDGGVTSPKDIALKEILALCRERSGDAHAKLAKLASLTEARAREIVRSPNSSLAAKIGAARSLPANEALAVLKEAAKSHPDDPYVQYELAKALAAIDGKESEAAAAFASFASLDAENAMAHYRLASALFRQGDVAGATSALQRASAMDKASEYSLSSEAYRVQALAASGVEVDTARLLTAATEGMGQYDDIVSLGAQLLGYGQELEKQGNSELARQIYEAVNTLGNQLFSTSPVASEQLAGLDVQQSAIQLLSEVLAAAGLNDSLEALNTQANGLINSINAMGNLLNSVSGLFTSSLSQDQLNQLVGYILQNGDSSVTQAFKLP